MFKHIIYFLLFAFILTSCGSLHIEKRHFRKGFHLSWNKRAKQSDKSENVENHLDAKNQLVQIESNASEKIKSSEEYTKSVRSNSELNDVVDVEDSRIISLPNNAQVVVSTNTLRFNDLRLDKSEFRSKVDEQRTKSKGLIMIIIGSLFILTGLVLLILRASAGLISIGYSGILLGLLLLLVGIAYYRNPAKIISRNKQIREAENQKDEKKQEFKKALENDRSTRNVSNTLVVFGILLMVIGGLITALLLGLGGEALALIPFAGFVLGIVLIVLAVRKRKKLHPDYKPRKNARRQ